MKTRRAALLCAVVVCAALVTLPGFAGEKQASEGKGQQDHEKMMEKMIAMGQPGPHHDHLKVFEGARKRVQQEEWL